VTNKVSMLIQGILFSSIQFYRRKSKNTKEQLYRKNKW